MPWPNWTNAERVFVGNLLRQGFTCSGIAKVLGMTRSQIAARINRDGPLKACRPRSNYGKGGRVPKEPKKPPRPKAPLAPLAPPLNIGRVAPNDPLRILARADELAKRRAAAGERPPAALPPPRVRTPKPAMRLVPLIDLRRLECRWPAEEDHGVTGHFLFCGAPAADEVAPYCQHHTERAKPGPGGRDDG